MLEENMENVTHLNHHQVVIVCLILTDAKALLSGSVKGPCSASKL